LESATLHLQSKYCKDNTPELPALMRTGCDKGETRVCSQLIWVLYVDGRACNCLSGVTEWASYQREMLPRSWTGM